MFLEIVEKHLTLVVSIGSSLAAIAAWKWKAIWNALIRASFLVRGPFVIERMLREQGSAIETIRKEVLTNGGGSLKDAVTRTEKGMERLESFRQHDFWSAARPSFEMDGEAKVLRASEASCRLFRVADPDELTMHSYLRFLEPARVGEFKRSFNETAASGSQFRFGIRVRAEGREDRGEWEFKATAIETSGSKLYSGHFSPVDDTAKAIAQRAGWQF